MLGLFKFTLFLQKLLYKKSRDPQHREKKLLHGRHHIYSKC